MRHYIWLPMMVVMAGSAAAAKDAPTPPRPAAFQKVVDCRAVSDQSARLACYDQAVAALDAAAQAKDVVLIDKEQVRVARHTLFGLPLPNFHLFGDDGDHDKNEVTQIESKIAAASPAQDGWRISLQDGTVWVQTDGKPIFRTPKAGLDVVVRRGTLGSYILRVEGAPGVKVKRVL